MRVIPNFLLIFVVILISFGLPKPQSFAMAQKADEVTRKLWDTAFIEASTSRKPSKRRSRYRIATTDVPVNNVAPETVVGVTLWRLRAASRNDSGERLIVHDNNASSEWIPERIAANTKLAQGDRLRISVEAVRAGYLYVIDREQYADGSLGEPGLIFPTQKTRDANYVKPGRLIYIPSASGKFRIKPSEGPKQHVGELVTMIVASEPLIDPEQLGPRSIKLPRQQVESWEKEWGVATTRFEMADGAGAAMTEKEQAAGANAATEFTQDDPVPQTVYRVAIKPEKPILVSVPMKFRR